MSNLSEARILVVTDQPDSAVPACEGAEFEVIRSQPTQVPLRRLVQARFDVVVTDVTPPATKGIALLDRIRAHGLELPVLVVSRTRTGSLAARVSSSGGEVCSPRELAKVLRRTLKRILLERAAQASFRGAETEERRLQDDGLLSFRNRRGESVDIETFTATAAKNEFGKVLDAALQRGAVAITRHDAPRAVLLDVEEYKALVGGKHRQLDMLTAQFDEMLARMQAPAARNAIRSAFGASPAELGKAAVAAAMKTRE